ncbi:hypothetical protein BCR44DRAFT_1431208, partial [Catenaria anguillulae PL171]
DCIRKQLPVAMRGVIDSELKLLRIRCLIVCGPEGFELLLDLSRSQHGMASKGTSFGRKQIIDQILIDDRIVEWDTWRHLWVFSILTIVRPVVVVVTIASHVHLIRSKAANANERMTAKIGLAARVDVD